MRRAASAWRRFRASLSRGRAKPPRVILVRGGQECRLAALRAFGGWRRRADALARRWDPPTVARFVAARRGEGSGILAPDAMAALRAAARSGAVDHAGMLETARRFRAREFTVLGASVPRAGAFPWHTDWRWAHTWPPMYFRRYDVKEVERAQPYDVKIPWELSRLWWLLPMVQAGLVEGKVDEVARDLLVLEEWERQNPLAHSVNWYAMEASMRGITLVMLLETLLAAEGPAPAVPPSLLRLIAAHGAFVWRTREYSDVRGNHYAANLLALLLCGLALRGFEPEASRWVAYASAAIPGEIEHQFLTDGVNFEKSLGYHRLVTEFFLVALIALQRAGTPVPPAATQRLHAAFRYMAACTRPDGLLPNVGDNDDARVLTFDSGETRDPRPLLGVAAAFFDDGTLKPAGERPPLGLLWLLGARGLTAWQGLVAREPGSRYWPEGGVVVARKGGNFLWMDVGEVGIAGRGGHGHNDLLSFELVLGGRPLVIDPGCFVYTGDARARDLFRSTAYHNGLRVDGVEIAPLQGMWRIGADAVPADVLVRVDDAVAEISAGHRGYERLSDPVRHARTVRFDPDSGAFSCVDHVTCRGKHRAERFLHLAPGVELKIEAAGARVSDGTQAWRLRWSESATARVEEGWVSEAYGSREPGTVVILTDDVAGSVRLWLSLDRAPEHE
jgi:heparinase II/III-like protein